MIAEAQKLGGVCAFIDAEHAMDPLYAQRIGVDIDELLVSQPDYGEQALEIADMLVRSGAVDLIAIDSVAALTPRAELEGQMGDQTVGLQARMMSQAMRKLAGNLNRTQTICLFTNQIREKVGVMFGSPETQPGGRALKFYSSQRLDIRRIETLKEGTEAVGNRVRVKVVKNKVAAPFRQAEFDIEFGKGISTAGCILDLGLEHDMVTKSGSFFSYGDERLGQGRNNAKGFLDENPEIAQEIEDEDLRGRGHRPQRRGAARRRPGRGARDAARGRGPGLTLAWGGVGDSSLTDLADLSAAGEVTAVSAPDSDPAVRRQRALDAAYRYLARRDRTVLEMRRHLEGRRVEPDAIEQAVGELCEQGYLDDARYARTFAEDRRALDGWGPDRIGRRLAQVGVDRDLVEAALAARGGGRRVGGGRRGPAPEAARGARRRPRTRARARAAGPPRLQPRAGLRRGPRVRARGLMVARAFAMAPSWIARRGCRRPGGRSMKIRFAVAPGPARWMARSAALRRRDRGERLRRRLAVGPSPRAVARSAPRARGARRRTRRCHLGANVVPLGRNPFLLAKELAQLDGLTGGRLLLSFVPGLGAPEERETLGVEGADRGAVLEEVLGLMRAWWAGEVVDHHSPRWSFSGVAAAARPVQDPLEVWLGGRAASPWTGPGASRTAGSGGCSPRTRPRVRGAGSSARPARPDAGSIPSTSG